jgi:23S rRNA A1618 N6-methylase RlmF
VHRADQGESAPGPPCAPVLRAPCSVLPPRGGGAETCSLGARSQALLDADFGLVWDLPLDRLCPTIPQKLNYIHWVEDLVALRQRPGGGGGGGGARGIDVGTGASCIYPLLGTAMHPDWSFVATEVDDRSRASATANVVRNKLQVQCPKPSRPAGTSARAPLW